MGEPACRQAGLGGGIVVDIPLPALPTLRGGGKLCFEKIYTAYKIKIFGHT